MGRSIASVSDVTDYIDSKTKVRGRLLAMFWLALGGLFLDAYSNSALSAGLDELTKQLDLGVGQVAFLTTSATVVALIFNPIGGWMADKWGRVRPLVLAKFLAAAGAALAAFAPGFALLLFGRFLVGAAYGIDFAIAMALLAEYTPKRFSNRLNVWQGIWYTAVSANLVLAIVFYKAGVGLDIWRWLLGSAGVFAIALMILQWMIISESPTWLARKGRYAAAARSLTRVFNEPFVAVPLEQQAPVVGQANKGFGNVALLFRGIYLRRTVLGATVQVGQGLEYFAVGWYLPIISLQLFGAGFVFATLGTLVFNLFGILGGFLSPVIGKKLGLRRVSAAGFGVVFLMLVIMGLTFGHLPLWASFILPSAFIFFHSAGPGANGKSISSLSYRSELRATANGFVGAVGSLGSALGLFLFPVIKAALGLGPTFLIIAAIPLAGFIICTVNKWEPTQALIDPDEEDDAPTFAGSRAPEQLEMS